MNTETIAANSCTAFDGFEKIATGSRLHVAERVKLHLEKKAQAQVLIFDDSTSELVEIDFRGSLEDLRNRIKATENPIASSATLAEEQESSRGRGRPKLGVTAREVTLLPRHWEWLNAQAGGASVALRKLVDQARRQDDTSANSKRKALESTYRFMSATAGNLPDFEEATRALFAGDRQKFQTCISPWPQDINAHVCKISAPAFHDSQAAD